MSVWIVFATSLVLLVVASLDFSRRGRPMAAKSFKAARTLRWFSTAQPARRHSRVVRGELRLRDVGRDSDPQPGEAPEHEVDAIMADCLVGDGARRER